MTWAATCGASSLRCHLPTLVRQLRSFGSGLDHFGAPPSQPARRVVVTGIGLVTPLGVGVEATWRGLLAGETGVRGLRPEDLPPAHQACYEALPSKVVACVPAEELAAAPWAPQADPKRTAKFSLYALCAAAEAVQDAGLDLSSEERREATGVAIGAGMSSTADIGEAGVLVAQGRLRRLSPFFVPRILVNMAAGLVSIAHGLRGPNHAAGTACATGAHSIGDAYRLIRDSAADAMLAGGTESCVDAVSLAGFARLKALSTRYNDTPAAASRPFDAGRDGFVMGEGAGVLVLEEAAAAAARGARVYAEVRGYGMSGDGHHITQPDPGGRGAVLAMRRALAGAGLAPQQLCYINAHATSTPIGDDIEQRAIAEVCGEAATSHGAPVAVSSTKGATGHLLGAAGAVEAAFAVLALHHGMAPPGLNLEAPDPAVLGRLLAGGGAALPPGPRAVLTNSFGFGGTNAALVFATPPG